MKTYFDNLIYQSLRKHQDYDAIIQVGSNVSADFLSNSKDKKSDIDIIVLGYIESHQIKTIFDDKLFDISFINSNEFILLLHYALQGSPFSAKVFSASINYKIIIDKNGVGAKFMRLTKEVYDLYKNSSLPNYKFLTSYTSNILANKNDIPKQEIFETNFIKHRLFSHLTDYISHLIYPFHTSGKYRGQVFKNYLVFNDNDATEGTSDFISNFISKYEPIFNQVHLHSYTAIVYNSSIEKLIKDKAIRHFFFGYDSIDKEDTIIFMETNDFSQLSINEHYELIDISNAIPGLKETELQTYFERLSSLSINYFDKSLADRLHTFYSILLNIDKVSRLTFQKAIKAAIVQKSCHQLAASNTQVELNDFIKWYSSFDFNLHEKTLNQNISNLDDILVFLNKESGLYIPKLREIQITYMLFGFMKALRINIDDLELT